MAASTPVVAMSGSDTIYINNRQLVDFADGNIVEIKYANQIANVKTGKNGNSIYSFNATGSNAEVMMRIMRGSADDKFLLGLMNIQQLNFAAFPLMIAQFIKKMGDGAGNIGSNIYFMSGGVFTKLVEAKSNVEGDTEQSVSIYTLMFSNAPSVLT